MVLQVRHGPDPSCSHIMRPHFKQLFISACSLAWQSQGWRPTKYNLSCQNLHNASSLKKIGVSVLNVGMSTFFYLSPKVIRVDANELLFALAAYQIPLFFRYVPVGRGSQLQIISGTQQRK